MVTLGLGSGGYYMFEKYRLSQDELIEARAAGENARHQTVELDQKIMSLEAELSRTRGEFTAARKRAGEKNSGAMAARLEAMIPAESAELVRGGDGRLNLALDDSLLFSDSTTELSDEGEELLSRVAAVLATSPKEQIWVYGHAAGTEARNASERWKLSSARALAVVDYLQSEASIDPARMAAVSFGSRRAGPRRSRNKSLKPRIELVLFPRNARRAG